MGNNLKFSFLCLKYFLCFIFCEGYFVNGKKGEKECDSSAEEERYPKTLLVHQIWH